MLAYSASVRTAMGMGTTTRWRSRLRVRSIPQTGFVVDLKELKDVLEREVVSVYDHRHLNLEVPEFAEAMPTTENIAIAVWRRLDGKVRGAKLHRVRVYEMLDLFADYYGEL